MTHEIHFPILKDLGLSDSEALIYELLLEFGKSPARPLIQESGLGRGNVYNVLKQLITKGFVLEIQGKQTQYQATDPSELQKLVELKQRETSKLEAQFSDALPELLSTFNLSTGRPIIQFFEGWEGFETALADSLTSTTEILTYVDLQSLAGEAQKINQRYVKQRIKAGIPKKLLVADSPEARDFFTKQNTPLTEVKFVTDFPNEFKTSFSIYDGKINYLTLSEEKQISVIIQDPNIFHMHRSLFLFLWNQAAKVIPSGTISDSNTA